MTRRAYKVTPVRVVARFLVGAPLSGVPVSDATWLWRGARPAAGRSRVTSWSLWPGYRRMAVNWFVLLVLAGSGYGWVMHRRATEVAWLAAAVLLAVTV